ncbi:response regulator rcp1 [Geobacter sp. OR-1]|uniref:response regulator n=1 Tax=Geobacter sp. OR-1 TaxID=1266765 RepID=UPI000543473E|nr:response regulator [Geobacter sp. OR-1]GAM11264.1 response regulator rcp1 [Geobacter sp. OR-1]
MDTYAFSSDDQQIAQGKTILLVEDNSNDALMTQRAMKKSNILNKVIWLKDGAEALEYLFVNCLEKGEPFPQLILLDIHMPRVNGIEVLQKIRSDERTCWLPVVIFTSSTEERDLIDSYRLGVNSYISKPIDFSHFAPVVSTIGCYWLLINHGPPDAAGSVGRECN